MRTLASAMPLRGVVALLFAPFVSLAGADDAYYGASGTPEGLAHSKQIKMASEHVHMWISPEKTRVKAVFHFVNHGPAITIRMGFPDDTYNSEGDLAIKRMDSWVDGKKVIMRRDSSHPAFLGSDRYSSIWVKTVSFPAHGKRTVVVEYVASNFIGDAGNAGVNYILMTGGTWKGPIGECVVSVDWSQLPREDHPWFRRNSVFTDVSANPLFRSRPGKPRYHTFRWENLRPKYDLAVEW